jgi:alkylation response protein AidB-like acyl-CoA dehydrogenase
MNLQPDSEQAILRETVERFLAEHYDDRSFQTIAKSEAGFSAALWRDFAEMGWLGLPFALEDGGSGGGAAEIAILMEAFGKHLVLEPYLPTVLLAGGLIAALATGAERQQLLAPIIAGNAIMAFANEDGALPVAAERRAGGYVLSGSKRMVLGAPMATNLLVSAALPSGRRGVFVVQAETQGLTVKPYRLLDGRRAADLELGNVALPGAALIGGNGDAEAAIDSVIASTIAALCADAVGAMTAMVAATVEYAKTRVQFGQPIGKFQALQHRLVAMKVQEEEARAAALLASLSRDAEPAARTRAVSGAKAKIGRAARLVHQDAIQLHGAIGTTAELPLGAYAKRLIAFETLFGATRVHLRRYAAAIADPAVAATGLLG